MKIENTTICSEIEFETFVASARELRSTLQLFALQLSLPCLHKYSCISRTNKDIHVHLFSHNRRAYLDFVKCFSMSGKKYEFLFLASFGVQTACNLSNLWKWGKTMQVMAQPLKTSFLVGKIFLVFDFDLGKKRKCSHLSYDFGALVMTTLDTAHKVKNVPVKIFYT